MPRSLFRVDAWEMRRGMDGHVMGCHVISFGDGAGREEERRGEERAGGGGVR
jgi:hypothetical protein